MSGRPSRKQRSRSPRRTPSPVLSGSGSDTDTPRRDRDSRSRGRKKRTFVYRLCNDFTDLPWDKVVAALISGLLIVVGASRVFVIGDEVGRTKVLVERTKADVTSDLQRLRQSVANWETTVDMVMKKTEERVLKQLTQEVKHIQDRLQQELSERHELDKRIAMLEIKFQLLAASDNGGSGGGGGGDSTACRADHLPPLIEAYERQKRTDEAFSAVSVQVERLQTRMDLMLRAQQERAALPSPTRRVVLEEVEVLAAPGTSHGGGSGGDDGVASPTKPVSATPGPDDVPRPAHDIPTPKPALNADKPAVVDEDVEAVPPEPEPTPTTGDHGSSLSGGRVVNNSEKDESVRAPMDGGAVGGGGGGDGVGKEDVMAKAHQDALVLDSAVDAFDDNSGQSG